MKTRLRNGGAEYSGNYWNSAATVANVAYHGEHSFQINGNELYQLFRLYPGKTYTFSGYIKINGTTASNGGVSLAFQESISTTEVRDIMNSPQMTRPGALAVCQPCLLQSRLRHGIMRS